MGAASEGEVRFHQLEAALSDGLLSGKHSKDRSDELSSALSLLRQTQKFYAGRREKLPKAVGDLAYSSMPRLPFENVAIEYEDYFEDGLMARMIVLCSEVFIDGVRRLIFWPFVLRENWSSSGLVVYDNGFAQYQFSAFLRPGYNREAHMRNIRSCVNSVIRFLAVLNCVNVRTDEVPAPAALNKKRSNSGRPPIYSYKTLVLRPAPPARAHGGGTHDAPRIHLRRGHIKRRKTGNFWWQPHVVGDRSKGVVMKDYRADELAKHLERDRDGR